MGLDVDTSHLATIIDAMAIAGCYESRYVVLPMCIVARVCIRPRGWPLASILLFPRLVDKPENKNVKHAVSFRTWIIHESRTLSDCPDAFTVAKYLRGLYEQQSLVHSAD